MKVGDKVMINTGIGYAVEGRVVAIFQREDAPIKVEISFVDGESFGDYYESELEVIS